MSEALTQAQIDLLNEQFTYHAPTDEQRPKYAKIGVAAEAAQRLIVDVTVTPSQVTFDNVNVEFRRFAEEILTLTPQSADQTAAIRCIRLARNAVNEYLTCRQRNHMADSVLLEIARAEVFKAKWQANSAIALNGR